jgi:hypothetical protein
MEGLMEQPGLDGRHRDKDGRIAKKHGNTLVASIRLNYPGFAPNERGSAKLIDVLDRLDEASLTKLLNERD